MDPEPSLDAQDPAERAAACALLGAATARWPRGTSAALAALASGDADPRVRAAALTALVRRGGPRDAARAWSAAARDAHVVVRRRAAELAPDPRAQADDDTVLELLGDADALVAESAAFALGERDASPRLVAALAACATTHDDPLVRDAAVAAIGALGDPAGLDAVLAACADKPAIRRRAVLALAAFSGARVEAALRAALEDRDWQVRQAAEDLLGIDADGPA